MVAIRYPGGQMEEVPPPVARALLRSGLVELMSALPNEEETAMVAAPEDAMMPKAQPRRIARESRMPKKGTKKKGGKKGY